jgi:hypothetical protein
MYLNSTVRVPGEAVKEKCPVASVLVPELFPQITYTPVRGSPLCLSVTLPLTTVCACKPSAISR